MRGHHPEKTLGRRQTGFGFDNDQQGGDGRVHPEGAARRVRPGGYGPATALFESAGNYRRVLHGGN